MKSLQELLTKAKTLKEVPKYADSWLVEHGYIKTEVYGWEKPEFLERFNLNPNAKGIPCYQVDDWDIKEEVNYKKDVYGQKIGDKEVMRKKIPNSRKSWVATPNYLAYREFKKQLYRQWYAIKFGIPPEEY